MRVGILGRTSMLLETARRTLEAGYDIPFVYTTTPASHDESGRNDLAEFAAANGIAFFDDSKVVSRMNDLSADVCLSINWLTVLPQSFLDHFAYGIFNAHAGDLPRYRGNATLNWAILNGEPEACLTIHQMSDGLDAGPIALQATTPITAEVDITDLYAWLAQAVPDSFMVVLDRLARNELTLTPQDESIRPFRAFPRKPQDSRILWTESTESILRLVRASSRPFAGAFSALEDGAPVIVYRAREWFPDYDFSAVPGQVCLVTPAGNPVIATSDGMVELVECDDDAATKSAITRSLRNRLV